MQLEMVPVCMHLCMKGLLMQSHPGTIKNSTSKNCFYKHCSLLVTECSQGGEGREKAEKG